MRENAGEKSASHFETPWRLIIIFLLFSIGIGFVGYFYLQSEKKALIFQKQSELSAVADLKVRLIVDWRKERMTDAFVIMNNPLTIHYIEEYLRNSRSLEARDRLLKWMASRQENYGYRRFSLIDVKGRIRLSVPDNGEILGPDAIRLLGESISTKKIIFSEIYRGKVLGEIRLGLFIPIINKDTHAIGAFLIRIDVYSFLLPLIQSWPTPSETSETILCYRDGEEVVFVNQPRHEKGEPLTFRFPVSQINLPEAMAVRGLTGITEGVDYRGKPVLAALRHIPGSSWFLLTKADMEEIHGPFYEKAWSVGILVGSWILAFSIVLVLLWRKRIAQIRWRDLQIEFERQTLEKRFDFLSKFANDSIILAEGMKIVEVNDRAVETYGYTRDELLQLHVWNLRTPETRSIIEQEFERQVDGKGSILETMHQRKDGRVFL